MLAPQTDRERLQTLAQRIIDRLKTPFRIGLIEVYTGCSIGIALCPEHGNDLDSLIRSADTAMYVAKEHGKRTYTVFSPEMNKRVAEYMWLDTNLRKGTEQNQLVLYYQPKIDARSGEVHSVEALVRWDSPERGLIPPLQFISYAEESGLIGPLGQWVLQTAAGRAAVARQGLNLRVAVNLSARQLADDSIVNDLLGVLRRHRMAPCLLDFELTESSLIEDENRARALITRLRELGAQVHLDDFGTGYSSLAQLARIPLDAIKLDKSFVRGVNFNPVSQSLVRAIVAAAEALAFRVIAEGWRPRAKTTSSTRSAWTKNRAFCLRGQCSRNSWSIGCSPTARTHPPREAGALTLAGTTQVQGMAILQHHQPLDVGAVFSSMVKAECTQSSVMSISSERVSCNTRWRARSMARMPLSFGRMVSMKVRVAI